MASVAPAQRWASLASKGRDSACGVGPLLGDLPWLMPLAAGGCLCVAITVDGVRLVGAAGICWLKPCQAAQARLRRIRHP